MQKTSLIAATIVLAASTMPAAAQDSTATQLSNPGAQVSQAQLLHDVQTLVSFGTRHTMSSSKDPKRGIEAARQWAAGEFRKYSEACSGCLSVVMPETMVSGPRVPVPTRLADVVAIQRGTERPNEVVIVQGHIDSRVTDVMNATSDAPGANDDGSGSAVALEAARVLSRHKYPTTIVYALLSGEEQGLYGGKLLADFAKKQGWTVKAVLNNDIVGNSCGSDGFCDDAHVRVFSEGPRADLSARGRAEQRRDGGENDSPSRNLSRFIAGMAATDPTGVAVRQIWRTDRMGRGGDQIPFLNMGYPAIRFTVAVENYNHQHQDLRTENGIEYGDTVKFMDFAYLARVARLNVRTLDELARAPMPPSPTANAAVSTDTVVSWKPVDGADLYIISRRRTDAANWDKVNYGVRPGTAPAVMKDGKISFTLPGLRGDDWILGVSACTDAGDCSPVASAVPGGGFAPLANQEGDSH